VTPLRPIDASSSIEEIIELRLDLREQQRIPEPHRIVGHAGVELVTGREQRPPLGVRRVSRRAACGHARADLYKADLVAMGPVPRVGGWSCRPESGDWASL
jgi:hypothetical protein